MLLRTTVLTLAAATCAYAAPASRPSALRFAPGPPPACKLAISDVVGRFPTSPRLKKRPAFDIVVINLGQGKCGTPKSGYNFLTVESYTAAAHYMQPLPGGGRTEEILSSDEQNRQVPDFPQSLPQLDDLAPGQTAFIHIATPNGYCVQADPDCIPDHADFTIRVRVIYVPKGGAPKISRLFEKRWSVLSVNGAEYNVEKFEHARRGPQPGEAAATSAPGAE